MKLHLTTAENNNLITAYGAEYIEVNRQRYTQNLIVMPDTVISDWSATTFAELNNDCFWQIVQLKPELVLLGTGATHLFPHPENYQILRENNVTLECMNTAAACRTYNILMSEGRNVAAALII